MSARRGASIGEGEGCRLDLPMSILEDRVVLSRFCLRAYIVYQPMRSSPQRLDVLRSRLDQRGSEGDEDDAHLHV
jgi:hypothetical protein